MFDLFKKYLKSQFGYEVKEFAVYEFDYEKNKIVPAFLSVFGVFLILFIVDVILGWGVITWWLMIILLILFVVLPLTFLQGNRYRAIYVTPEYIVEQTERTVFHAIKFDDIIKYRNSVDGVVIEDKINTITLDPSMHRDEVEGIIDILESKGKTFDQDKQFMIRPVDITIVNNKIRLIEQEVVTDLDRVYDHYAEQYFMLTPGYVDEISFRNVNVDDVCIDEEYSNVSFKMDAFEVRAGHPENTTFDSINVLDGIAIFHKLEIQGLILVNEHDDDAEDERLPNDFRELPKYLNKSNISDWRVGKNNVIDFFFATGVFQLKARFKYKDIIIGWNKTKE
jgi:hypothetical protein